MIPWLAFSEAAGNSSASWSFPSKPCPSTWSYSGLVGEALTLILFTAGLWIIRGHIPATVLYLPLLLIPQILFSMGVTWLVAVVGAYFRDLIQVSGYLLTVWFFTTPICYPEKQFDQLPKPMRSFLIHNPIYILVQGYRAIFLQSRAPDWRALAWLTAFSLALFLFGHATFYKLRKSFADIL